MTDKVSTSQLSVSYTVYALTIYIYIKIEVECVFYLQFSTMCSISMCLTSIYSQMC